jgi:damage-control phosphatase, subfamily III
MCEICLWGNATDLSLLTNLSYEDIQKLQGSEARKKAEKNILVNDLPAVYDLLRKSKSEGNKERRVDIVLDNAGFELFVDLILAGYLLSSGLATHVVLHPKDIPWFVSDVLPSDFAELLNALANPKGFYETPSEDELLQNKTPEPLAEKEAGDLSFLFQNWSQLYAQGQVILRPNRFWTHPGSFWRLPGVAKELYEDLKTSDVIIFKGDLNYRKLTGDVSFPSLPATRVPVRPSAGGLADTFFYRHNGMLRRLSPRQLARWGQDLGSTCWPCGPARRTSLWVCPQARTRNCVRWTEEEATRARGSGHGTASGP